jgi:hypothetical protein
LAKGKNVGDKRADTKEKDLRRERERGEDWLRITDDGLRIGHDACESVVWN